MEKGRILFLNGVTSSGKTSLVEELQKCPDPFFYVLANDLFQETVGEDFLHENYWKYLSQTILMMYRTARLFSENGKNVLIDGILVEREELKPHLKQVMEILDGCPLDFIHVDCPLSICRARNLARGDRGEFQSQEQAAQMARDIPYSFTVDTSLCTPAEGARLILQHIFRI